MFINLEVWGVSTVDSTFTWSEFKYHVIHGWRIKQPYQTGILSGNNGYAFKSDWFKDVQIDDYTDAPKEAKLVDDIWINGHAARLGIKRVVVPSEGVNIALGGKSAVESSLTDHASSRSEANNVMLHYFGKEFGKENIEYQNGGKNGPHWANMYYLSLILPLKERWIEFFMPSDVVSAYWGK